ncbi:MAG TPA: o-succinylbenzoate synthase [Blastocatellia bacterium]|nr:o-succinylbenzoate synthase [Blastocatellia bacterium]
MRLDSVELREIRLELLAPFETSFGVTTTRNIIIASVRSGDTVGWGECTVGEGPFYSDEFTDSAWVVLGEFVIPPLLAEPLADAADVNARLAPIRGHRMARAAVENAVWDLEARLAGIPLWRHLGGERPSIDCGVSIGLQPTVDGLLAKVEKELAAGYQRIKIKIAPGRDVALVRAVRERFGDIVLSVDANSAYTLADIDTLKALDDFGLLMIEQPLRAGDLIDHARVQAELTTAICLDESIVDDETARQALEIGACRIINIKLGRVGGHLEARRIAERCATHGVPVWCGGMLEAGIGRLQNAAMSSLAPFTLPGDVSDSRRYWTRDIVTPRPSVGPDGRMLLPEGPGIGADVDLEFLESITTRRAEALA